jgi:acyl-CoA reductase-like NAD-dependent aldehyde dehydrogenase
MSEHIDVRDERERVIVRELGPGIVLGPYRAPGAMPGDVVVQLAGGNTVVSRPERLQPDDMPAEIRALYAEKDRLEAITSDRTVGEDERREAMRQRWEVDDALARLHA